MCVECGGGSVCVHGKRKLMCVECGGGSLCVHGKRKLTCKICSEPALAALPRAMPPPPKKFQEFLKTLGRTSPSFPVPSPSAISAAPILQLPTAAESFASMLAATTSFSNMELFKLMQASNAHAPSTSCLPAPLPFLHPFVASMLLGGNPILTQTQFGTGVLPILPLSQSLGSFQNPLAFNHTS